MKIRVNHNPCAWTCLTFFSLFKSAKATLKAVDGCDHSSECVATYWRTIWILILVVSLLYLISVAWTFWISSKWKMTLRDKRKFIFFLLEPPCQTPFRKPTLLLWISFAIWPEIFASFRSCSEKILLFVRRPGFQVWLGFGQSSSRVSEAPNAQGILGKVASTICRNCLSWL